ncbi:MAG: diaminopimelate decarboxylase [bacterium]|nr:diaminopimelate decarboxylase [bacterium]MDZ4247707.1 diaminopimelate decarboxylase [Patescibacteria group bacterium]
MRTATEFSKLKQAAKRHGTPLYVYDERIVTERYRELAAVISYPNLEIHFAVKANSNPRLLKLLKRLGADAETVSPGEIRLAKRAGFTSKQIAFTCANASAADLDAVIRAGGTVNADSLYQLEYFAKRLPKRRPLGVRINQGIAGGHHKHVMTGGPDSKFGIDPSQVRDAKRIAAKYGRKIDGVHQHIGSNVLDPPLFAKAMRALLGTARQFDELDYVDFGGGFGIPYRPGEPRLDIPKLGKLIDQTMADFVNEAGYQPRLAFEPGRYLVAEAGTLVVSVTDYKITPHKTFVGVDSGFNQLLRPAMYGSYHHIENASNPRGRAQKVTVAGNVCESGDVFAKDRPLAAPRIGDLLAIRTAGAYGETMASTYNARPLPKVAVIT